MNTPEGNDVTAGGRARIRFAQPGELTVSAAPPTSEGIDAHTLAGQVLAWLGFHRDDIPAKAVESLQDVVLPVWQAAPPNTPKEHP